MFRRVSYDHFLQARMGVMDSTAVTLCRDNNLPIRVFALGAYGNIRRVVLGEPIGTLVSEAADLFANQAE
jgi:uridylate kinase